MSKYFDEEIEKNANEKFIKHIVDILTIKDNQISDLEVKLAESEEKLKAMETLREMVNEDSKLNFKRYIDTLARNEQLEQQLAEKEKEIKDRINQIRTLYGQLYELQKAVEYCQEHHKKNKLTPLTLHNYTNEKHNQDKISFVVEKIQELKKSLRDKVCLMENDEHCYPQNAVHWQDVVALIDNQIKAIKEMK